MAIIEIEGKNWKFERGLSEDVAASLRSLILAIAIEKESLSKTQANPMDLSANSSFIQDFEDILENYRGDYFKININKFNKLKEKWLGIL